MTTKVLLQSHFGASDTDAHKNAQGASSVPRNSIFQLLTDALIPGRGDPNDVAWDVLESTSGNPKSEGISRNMVRVAFFASVGEACSHAEILNPATISMARKYSETWKQLNAAIGSGISTDHQSPGQVGLFCYNCLAAKDGLPQLKTGSQLIAARSVLKGLADDALVDEIDNTWGDGAARALGIKLVKALRNTLKGQTILRADTPVAGRA